MPRSKNQQNNNGHARACIDLANELIITHRLPIPLITKLGDINHFVFLQLFKAICKVQIPEIVPNPETPEQEVSNVQAIIDTLSLDILSISLFHITGEDIVSLNVRSIYNLLEIFSGLSDQVRSVRALSSRSSDDQESESSSLSKDLLPTREDGTKHPSHSRYSELSQASGSGSTDECIALGHLYSREKALSPDVPSYFSKAQSWTSAIDGIQKYTTEQPDGISEHVYSASNSMSSSPLDESVLKYGALTVPQNLKEYKSTAFGNEERTGDLAPVSFETRVIQGLKRKRGTVTHSAEEARSKLDQWHDDVDAFSETTRETPVEPIEINKIPRVEILVNNDKHLPQVHKSTSTSDIANLIHVSDERSSSIVSSEKRPTVNTETQTEEIVLMGVQEKKRTVNMEDIENLYSYNLLQKLSSKFQDLKQTRLNAAALESNLKSTTKRTPQTKKLAIGRSKSYLLPKRLRERSVGAYEARSSSASLRRQRSSPESSILQRLQNQFPGVQFSPSTLRQVEKKYKQHCHFLQKVADEVSVKKTKSQAEMEEKLKKQRKIAGIIRKEVAHNERLREVQERKKQQHEMRSLLQKRKLQSIRLKQYYEDYDRQMKMRMQKIRTKEENIACKLFEDTLKAEREDARELQQRFKDDDEKTAHCQRNYMESLENFYENHQKQLANNLEEARHDLQQNIKEQLRILREQNRDTRHRLVRSVQSLQNQIIDDMDDPHFVELEAQRLRNQLLRRKIESTVSKKGS